MNRRGNIEVKQTMEDLLKGKTFHTCLDEQIIFSQLKQDDSAIWSLLLASGYLKVENYQFNMTTGHDEYELKLTNLEVRFMFQNMVTG